MRRFSSRVTSGFRSTPRTSVKIAAFAPMPSASVRITMVASPLLRISEWNATLRSRKNDMFLVPWAFISTTRANRKSHIVYHLPWAASQEMVVFGSQCPNPDTDSFGIPRHVACGSEAAVCADPVPQTTIFDEHADPPSLTDWPADV